MLSPLTLLLPRVFKPNQVVFTCTVICTARSCLLNLLIKGIAHQSDTKWHDHQWLMEVTELVKVEVEV